ncbi:alpha/beta-hydrolase [Dentipellis sp. KUC8613]|nr:alpha/beta-hydrolase [Dentipellis sp. KUC8613]
MSSPPDWQLHPEISSRLLLVRDLQMHILEAGNPENALILLLHGFPELAYSWRKIMYPLAASGYHVVAPDQRGFGRTTSIKRDGAYPLDYPITYGENLAPYRLLNVAQDITSLVSALDHTTAHAVVGHDFGSLVAGCCTLIRPDVFKRVVMMSAPFSGFPALRVSSDALGHSNEGLPAFPPRVDQELARLDPPRKHYTSYFSTPEANEDMWRASGGLHAFLRAYYHVKSADWLPNNPHPLSSASGESLALMPGYYIMPIEQTMPETVLPCAPTREEVDHNTWLPDTELSIYVSDYRRTGFQGGLNWYRCLIEGSGQDAKELMEFGPLGGRINVPAMFIGGTKDWGVWQSFGAVDKMKELFVQMGDANFVLVPDAGHWVQQERPEQVVQWLQTFVARTDREC